MGNLEENCAELAEQLQKERTEHRRELTERIKKLEVTTTIKILWSD